MVCKRVQKVRVYIGIRDQQITGVPNVLVVLPLLFVVISVRLESSRKFFPLVFMNSYKNFQIHNQIH